MAVDEWAIDHAFVFCSANVTRESRITYLPWYMLMCLSLEGDSPFLVTW